MDKKNKLYFSIITAICLMAVIVCAICNFVISKAFTWSWIPISSITFAWLILLPSMILKKKIVITTLLSLTIFIIPFLYILSILIRNTEVLSIGAVMSVIGIIYLWSIVGIFQKVEKRKYIAIGISLLLGIPVCFIINIALSKMVLGPVIDIWDILTVSILLIISTIMFIKEYLDIKKKV